MTNGARRATQKRSPADDAGEMRAVLLGGIFSLPLMLGFVVLCSLGLAPSIVPALGAMEAPLTKLLIT